MEEGERLSKKQLAQESTIKKLRASGKEVAAEKARLEAQLAQDQGQLASTRHALEAATASLQVYKSSPLSDAVGEHIRSCVIGLPDNGYRGCTRRLLRRRTGRSYSGRSSTTKTCCPGRAPARCDICRCKLYTSAAARIAQSIPCWSQIEQLR